MSFYAQGVESQEPLLGLQLPLEPGKAYTISLTGLQANGSLSATVWRDGLEKTIIPLRLGPETKEGLNFEAFKPLGRMPVKEAGDEIGGTLEAEVIRFGGDPSEPSVILRPSPEPGPFPRFTQKFELGDEVWVEAVTIEEVPDENLVALVVKEEESGLEVAMEPSDLTFAGRFNVKETIKPGSRFKAVVKKILPDSCRVYLSCLPLLEKDLEAFSDRIDRELFDAQICEMTRQGLFVLITPSSANLPLGHMAYVHKGSLPRDRKSYKIGERCKVRLSFSNRCYANLPRLPKEVIEVLRSKKWRQKLKWEGESKKLLFQGQMSEEDRAELRELCEDVYFHRALDMLYRHSHSLHAEIIDLDLLRDFEERHKPGDRVTAIVKDIWGKVAVLELAPGVRTQVQLWDFALNLGEEPVRRVQKGNKVDVLIKSIVIEEGRVEVKPILPTDDLEERFPLGSTVQGKVVELKPYGAFVEIEPGITGLVRTREMSWCQVAKPSDVVSKGDTVTVRILAIRPDRKIDLSMRTEENDPERKYPPDSQVSVKIIKLKKYGALARLEPGIVGLIHISELDWDHIDHPREVVHEGQELTVRVKDVYQDLKVEGNPRRLDLSRKRAFQAKMIIPKTEIGKLIGRGGRTIKPIKEDTKTEIKVNDEGIVRIWGASEEGVNAAQERIKEVVPQAEVICED
jgi:ribosomal protein S1